MTSRDGLLAHLYVVATLAAAAAYFLFITMKPLQFDTHDSRLTVDIIGCTFRGVCLQQEKRTP